MNQIGFYLTVSILIAVTGCTPKPEPYLIGLLALPAASETAAFQVVSTVPTLNQTEVSTSSNVIITFNKNVDSSSITGNISLSQPSSNSIASLSASTSGKIVTLKPSSAFISSSSYTFTFKSSIKSTTSESLGTDYTLTFTTQ